MPRPSTRPRSGDNNGYTESVYAKPLSVGTKSRNVARITWKEKKPFEFANAEVDLTKTEVGLLEVACFFPSFFRFLFCESLLARNCDPSLVARGTRDALKSRAAPIRPKSNGVTDRESPELRSSDETVPCGTGAPLEIQTTVGKNKKKLEGQEGKRRGGCRNRKFSLLRPLKNSGATGGASSKLRGENRQAR